MFDWLAAKLHTDKAHEGGKCLCTIILGDKKSFFTRHKYLLVFFPAQEWDEEEAASCFCHLAGPAYPIKHFFKHLHA